MTEFNKDAWKILDFLLISSAGVQKRLILRAIFSIIWGVIITGAVPKHREYEGIMTRSQLITKVANDTGMTSNEVEKVMDCIFGTIGDVLKGGDKVTIAGFGRFEMRERQTKNFTNPKTKVTSQLQPTAIPGFKASGRLKEKVAQ